LSRKDAKGSRWSEDSREMKGERGVIEETIVSGGELPLRHSINLGTVKEKES